MGDFSRPSASVDAVSESHARTEHGGSTWAALQAALYRKEWRLARNLAEKGIADGEDEFAYSYTFVVAGLGDLKTNGAWSEVAGDLTAWADRAIRVVEDGKVPSTSLASDWPAARRAALATLYESRAMDALARLDTDRSSPSTDAYEPVIADLKLAIEHSEFDRGLYYLLGRSYEAQYLRLTAEFDELPKERKASASTHVLLERIHGLADALIDTYITLITRSDANGVHAMSARPKLATIWELRHPDDPLGWRARIGERVRDADDRE